METMRALSITMLFAGCGLHAFDPDTSFEPRTSKIEQFVLISDYKQNEHNGLRNESMELMRQSSKEDGVNENLSESEDFSDTASCISNGYESESFSDEEIAGLFEPEEIEIEGSLQASRRTIQSNRGTQQNVSHAQTTVFSSIRFVIPMMIGAGVVVSVGYAVYKHITAHKKNKKEEAGKKSTQSSHNTMAGK